MDNHGITHMETHLVDVSNIHVGQGPYCMSFGFSLEPIIQSITEIGLINSPLTTRSADGMVDVVAGYRRILALKRLKWKNIPCRDLSDSGLSPFQLLCLNLEDNLGTRNFNDVEKAMILARLAPHLPEEEILGRYMPLLDLPSYGQTLLTFIHIEQKLEKDIKACLARGRLSLQVVKSLLQMNAPVRSHVFSLIRDLNFNMNQQKQLIDFIIDISRTTEMAVPEILEAPSIQQILSNRRMNNPQKAKAILQHLRSKRLPLLVSAERAFKRKVSALGLPKGVRIKASPSFEGPDYCLEVRFREGKELAERITCLSHIKGLEELDGSWEAGSR